LSIFGSNDEQEMCQQAQEFAAIFSLFLSSADDSCPSYDFIEFLFSYFQDDLALLSQI
jgi:hypothetical protein